MTNKTEANELNLYQKLAKIRKTVEVLKKDKAGFNYRYVTDALILAKIGGLMDTLHVSLIPGVVPGTAVMEPYAYIKTKVNSRTKEVYDEKNAEILVRADMTYTWVNNDDPTERIVVPWLLVGQQQDASQAFGSGLTYTYRYFLLKYFGAATVEDDPDNWLSQKKEAEAAESKEIAEKMIAEVDLLCRQYMADHPEEGENVKKFFCRFAKDGNYKKIVEPVLASKLLDDFKKYIAQ